METSTPPKALPKKLGDLRRRSVSVDSQELVRREPLFAHNPLPLKIEPALDGVNLTAWAEGHRQELEEALLRHGGVLFRGFPVLTVEAFQDLLSRLWGSLLTYSYRSTPRSDVSGNIYTSTEYPADQWIPQHNEMSYTREWPLKIAFLSLVVAQEGGATPIADSRRVYQSLDPAMRDELARRQVMYVRNYSEALDLPWQAVFQTDDRAEVEAFCQRAGIEWQWRGPDRLRTVQVCQAVASHPVSGEPVWFNQAHLFHVSNLPAAVRESLLAAVGEDELPRNTYYGDGAPLEPEVLAEIRRVYEQESVSFPWQAGDVLLLDNMLASHGRAPFSGSRRVVVGMAQSFSEASPGA